MRSVARPRLAAMIRGDGSVTVPICESTLCPAGCSVRARQTSCRRTPVPGNGARRAGRL
jgi:hypothetical protein